MDENSASKRQRSALIRHSAQAPGKGVSFNYYIGAITDNAQLALLLSPFWLLPVSFPKQTDNGLTRLTTYCLVWWWIMVGKAKPSTRSRLTATDCWMFCAFCSIFFTCHFKRKWKMMATPLSRCCFFSTHLFGWICSSPFDKKKGSPNRSLSSQSKLLFLGFCLLSPSKD